MMLSAIVLTLKNGFEIALVLGMAAACLKHLHKAHLLRYAYAGAFAACLAGLFLAYNMEFVGGREVFEGWVMSVGIALTAVVLAIVVLRLMTGRRAKPPMKPPGRWRSLAEKLFAALLTFALTVIPAVDISLFPYNIFIQTFSVVNTDLIVKFAGGAIGLMVSCLFALAFIKNSPRLSSRQLGTGIILFSGALLFKQAVTLVQILLANRIIPLSSFVFDVLIPLINQLDKAIYALLSSGAVWVVLFAWAMRGRMAPQPGVNPALQRKARAAVRREWRWFATVACLIVFISFTIGAEAVRAGQKVELSPAEPVHPIGDGSIHVAVDSVDDRNLHRFGYTTADGTVVRFIIIRKSETSYGVAYDACELCGSAGYYQKGKKIICRKCDVVMNIPTIGFPGGCNPIPLQFKMDNGAIVIQSADLDSHVDIFQEHSPLHHG